MTHPLAYPVTNYTTDHQRLYLLRFERQRYFSVPLMQQNQLQVNIRVTGCLRAIPFPARWRVM
jgi:hypothetical protein